MIVIQLKYFTKFRLFVFQKLTIHIILFVLRLIASQYDLLIKQFTILLRCIKIFFTITNFSCNHKIQKRLYKNENLMLKNVHVH